MDYKNGYFQDMWDDLKIPFGLTKYSQRYQEAEKMLKDNQRITNVIGHSLGGSVSLELAKNHPEKKTIHDDLWCSCSLILFTIW